MTHPVAEKGGEPKLTPAEMERLDDLIDQYELAQDAGSPLSPEQLCASCPDLLPPLRDALRRLHRIDERLASVPTMPFPSRIGEFRVLELLGTGSTGMVFRCRQERPDRDVAVKVLKPLLDVDEQQNRFQREMAVFGAIREEGIAEVYQTGIIEWCGVRCFWIAMELLAQTNICDFLKASQTSLEERLKLFQRLCETVRSAHRVGILHRDIKPSNILMSTDGKPHLVDFGIARLPRAIEMAHQTDTGSPSLRGTTAWMAPELLMGDQTVRSDVRSEIFSLGVVLFEMLTGQHPFHAERLSAAQVAVRIVQNQQNRFRSQCPNSSADLTAFVERLMGFHPNDRYQNMDDVLLDLQRILDGQPVLVRRVPLLEQTSRWLSKRKSAVILATAFGILLIAAFSTFIYSRKVQKAEEQAAERQRLADEKVQAARTMAELHLQVLRERNLRAATTMPRETSDMRTQLLEFRESRDFFEGYLKLYPEDRRLRQSAGIAFHLLGIAANRLELHEESFESFQRAEQVFQDLKRDYPAESEFEFDIFSTVLGQASAHLGTPRSIELHNWCLDLITRLCQEQPDNMDYLDARACVLVSLGHEHAIQEAYIDLPYAKKISLEANEIARSICNKPNFKPLHQKHIATSASTLRVIANREGNYLEALNWSRIAVATQLRFIEHFPDPQSKSVLVRYYLCECEDSLKTGNLSDARKALDLVTSYFKTIEHSLPAAPAYQDIRKGLTEMSQRVKEAETVK